MNSLLMVAMRQAYFQSVVQLLPVVPTYVANQRDANLAISFRSNYFPIQMAGSSLEVL